MFSLCFPGATLVLGGQNHGIPDCNTIECGFHSSITDYSRTASRVCNTRVLQVLSHNMQFCTLAVLTDLWTIPVLTLTSDIPHYYIYLVLPTAKILHTEECRRM